MLNTFIDALLQVLAFTLIPLIVYLIRKKTLKGFLGHIGLIGCSWNAVMYGFLVALFIGLPFLLFGMLDEAFYKVLTHPSTVTGSLRLIPDFTTKIGMIFILAGIKTSLSEEIFFRGFVAKRLIAVTNFKTGNLIQALIFGAVHLLIFLTITDNNWFLISIFIMTTLAAMVKTYINEKLAGGSILPSWTAHGVGNMIAYSAIAFTG